MTLDAAIACQVGVLRVDVALALREGLSVLRGPTGCGKSTVLRALAGLTPMVGHVRLGGEELTLRPPEARPIGLVFQSSALFPHLDVRGNVAFGARGPSEVTAAIDQFGLSHLAHRRPATLSGGERQLVALARTLVRRPKLLLLDEPFSALDPLRRKDTFERVARHLADTGCVALLVTHSAEDAPPGTPTWHMQAGRLTRSGDLSVEGDAQGVGRASGAPPATPAAS